MRAVATFPSKHLDNHLFAEDIFAFAKEWGYHGFEQVTTAFMLHDTISKIEGRIKNSESIGDAPRAELLKLLGELKTEITTLSKTHQEQAESIASFTEVSAREATRESKNPQVLEHSIGGLQSSVEEFETTHPQLSALVNRIASLLANMGI